MNCKIIHTDYKILFKIPKMWSPVWESITNLIYVSYLTQRNKHSSHYEPKKNSKYFADATS